MKLPDKFPVGTKFFESEGGDAFCKIGDDWFRLDCELGDEPSLCPMDNAPISYLFSVSEEYFLGDLAKAAA